MISYHHDSFFTVFSICGILTWSKHWWTFKINKTCFSTNRFTWFIKSLRNVCIFSFSKTIKSTSAKKKKLLIDKRVKTTWGWMKLQHKQNMDMKDVRTRGTSPPSSRTRILCRFSSLSFNKVSLLLKWFQLLQNWLPSCSNQHYTGLSWAEVVGPPSVGSILIQSVLNWKSLH